MTRLPIGPRAAWFWRFMYRAGFARAAMPHWRVVVEAVPDRLRGHWPAEVEGMVVSVFVWARTPEEAEGLAQLAVDAEGLCLITADAARAPPACAPSAEPKVVARTDFAYFGRIDDHDPPAPMTRNTQGRS
ncbi:MAG: hypothetical protein ACOYKM_02415 [Caulobacterales bacterium]|jgi:hypothetical protein